KRKQPQTNEERIAYVAGLATAFGKTSGLAPEANRLDVHLQFERAISGDVSAKDLLVKEINGEDLEFATIAALFWMVIDQCGIDCRTEQAQERWSAVVDKAVTDCLNDPTCGVTRGKTEEAGE